MSIKECTVLVGIDWADKKHVYAVKNKGDSKHKIGSFLQRKQLVAKLLLLSNKRKDLSYLRF